MNTGTYISGAMHLGLIGWALLGGLFQSAPEPFEVADVSIISGEEFAALTAPAAAPRAEVPSEAPAPAPEPEPAPESEPAPEPAPEPEPEPIVEPAPVEPEPEAPVVEAPPLPPTPPAEQENESPIADVAAPEPAPRVAPTPAPPPPPDATPSPEVTQAPEPTPEAETPAPEEEATAPEEATTEIVTEAEETRETGLAPPSSIRPTSRPARPRPAPVAEAPAEEAPAAEPQEQQTAAIDDALAEALGGSETGGAGSAPTGPPLTAGEKDALRVAVGQCWNVGSLSSDALATTVVVTLSMNEDGTPRTDTIRLASHSGGSDAAARQTFESARRAIIRCGARGYNLPKEKFSRWRDIEMTFNPEKMRIK